jgi:hypothetical protein
MRYDKKRMGQQQNRENTQKSGLKTKKIREEAENAGVR